MAKIYKGPQITGSLGDISAVKRYDLPNVYLRYKGGASKERIKHDSNFARTRENNSEFSGVAASVKNLRNTIYEVIKFGDSLATGRLTKILKAIQLADSTILRGQRPVRFSMFGKWLNDFELNKNVPLNSVIKISEYTINRETSSATLVIPTLIPGINFSNPWHQPKYRIVVVLSTLQDMYYTKLGYKPLEQFNSSKVVCKSFNSGFVESNLVLNELTINLQLDGIALNDSSSLILAIGVQFGNEQPGGTKAVKRANCAKIIAIV